MTFDVTSRQLPYSNFYNVRVAYPLLIAAYKGGDMRSVLMALLMLVTSSAWAEWVKFGVEDPITFYINPATVLKDGHIRKIWGMYDQSKTDSPSSTALFEFKCKKNQLAILSLRVYSAPMATGRMIATMDHKKPDWIKVAPKTLYEAIYKHVCAE